MSVLILFFVLNCFSSTFVFKYLFVILLALGHLVLECGPVSLVSRIILVGFLPPRDPGQWMDRVVRSAKPFPPFPDDRGQTDWLLCTPEGVSWRPLDRIAVHWLALFLTHLHPDCVVNASARSGLVPWPVPCPRRRRSRGLRIPRSRFCHFCCCSRGSSCRACMLHPLPPRVGICLQLLFYLHSSLLRSFCGCYLSSLHLRVDTFLQPPLLSAPH